MTTAEALEALTDTGRFEILAMRALRHLYPECRVLEHIGVNAQAKPIPGPIDGYARVPGSSPSKYVAAAFTLASRDELRRKWYAHGNSDPHSAQREKLRSGDLIKACEKADAVRKDEPRSHFTVYLCTNQRLNDRIMNEGYAIGSQRAVEVIFIGQSRLRDFLDSADGQPLREEFLGLRATNISRELIQRLARVSLTQYQINGFSNDDFVPTAAWNEALEAISLNVPLLALVGRPGSGKSVIARSLLERHIQNGGIGLWIPGDLLEDALSLNDAVTLTLKQLGPYLGDNAGHSTSALASAELPLVLVLDDANRTDRPGTIIRKILSWGRNLASEQTERRGCVKVVVPVWESQFSNLEQDFEESKGFHAQSIGPMQRGEAITCLRNGLGGHRPDLSQIELDQIAERLQDDPILLSIFSRLVRTDVAMQLDPILDDVIGRFIDRSLADLASVKDTLKANYDLALAQVTRQMLVRKILHPEWRFLRTWLQPDNILHLEDIARRGDICRITNQGRRDIFEFRHDRILEHQLSKSIAGEFEAAEPDWNAVFDPFMVQATGRAMATLGATDRVLDLVAARLPTSLVAALAFLPAGDTALSRRLCPRVAKWLGSLNHEPPSVQDDTLSILQNTRSEHILTVTRDLAPSRPMLFVRLRNGDGVAGAAALSLDFYPSVHFSWLENLIAQAESRHRDKLVNQLATLLTARTTPNDLCGALTLAGYLSNVGLADAILVAWESAQHTSDVVLPALWAALRCSDPVGKPLSTILPAIFSVSDEAGAGGWTPRQQLFEDLAFSARHGFALDVLTFLRDQVERDERYESLVFTLFAHIDNPLCLEFVVRKMARQAAKPVAPGHISGVFMWENQWRRTSGFEYLPMPSDCTDALKEWWQTGNPDWLRSYAFKLWLRFSGNALWTTALPADLLGSDTAVWERAKRGDHRVAESVLQKMENESHWFQIIRYIWADIFEPALDSALKVGDSFAIDALRDVPNDLAERLILKNWKAINDKRHGIAAALFVATSSTVALASDALRSCAEPASRFRHSGRYFGFREHGYSDKITSRHLEIIRPYLQLFDDYDLADITEFCGLKGYAEWAHKNLLGECRSRLSDHNHNLTAAAVRRFFPSDEDLISDLNQIAASDDDRRANISLNFWANGFNERSDDPERMPRLLDGWLGSSLSMTKFRFAALAIRYQGSRRSLEILRRFSCTTEWPSMEGLYRDAEYAVMRRSLA